MIEEEIRIRHPSAPDCPAGEGDETDALVRELVEASIMGRIPWVFGDSYRAATVADLFADVAQVALFLRHDIVVVARSPTAVRFACRHSRRAVLKHKYAQKRRDRPSAAKEPAVEGGCPFSLVFRLDDLGWAMPANKRQWAIVCRTCPPCPCPVICRHSRSLRPTLALLREVLGQRTGPALLAEVVNADGRHCVDRDTVIRGLSGLDSSDGEADEGEAASRGKRNRKRRKTAEGEDSECI